MHVIKIFQKIDHEFKWEQGKVYVMVRKKWTKETEITLINGQVYLKTKLKYYIIII